MAKKVGFWAFAKITDMKGEKTMWSLISIALLIFGLIEAQPTIVLASGAFAIASSIGAHVSILRNSNNDK